VACHERYRDCDVAIGDDDRMIGKDDEASRVAAALANALKIGRNSLCFCGSGQKWKNCCGSNPKQNLVFLETAIETAKAYKASQGHITAVPVGIWNQVEKASSSRLPCLYPGCREKPVGCHLVPENVLRTYYGGHCNEYRMEDSAGFRFVKRGIGLAGCVPVFCSKHDHELFRKIDQTELQSDAKELSFLYALKATAFSLRKTQILLGVDSQLEIMRPFLIQEQRQAPPGSRFTIDISHLEAQYIRFVSCFEFYKKAMASYSSSNRDYFTLHRVIQTPVPIFFGGLTNPSHDLNLRKINDTNQAIVISCSVFAAEDGTNILLSCPDGLSRNLYREFLQQLGTTDDRTFATVLNNLLTVSVETLFVPETFTLNEIGVGKITAAKQLAAAGLKNQAIFDLRNANTPVKFI
jgi:SEC-C motif